MKFSYDIGWLPNYVEYDEIFSVFKSSGIDTLAFNFYCLNDRFELLKADAYKDNARRIRELLEAEGIRCNQTYSPFSLKYCDERINRFEENYGELVRALEFSAILGAEQIICYAIQTADNVSQADKNRRFYRSLISYCEKFSVKIALSSGFPKYLDNSILKTPWASAEEYAAFINSFNSPYLCACADVGGLKAEEAERMIALLGKDDLSAVHFKDPEKYHDAHMLPYFEKTQIKEIANILKNANYNGWVTFEAPTFMKKYPRELLGALCNLFSDIGRYVCNEGEGQ